VVRIGTAGWSVPGPAKNLFPGAGSHLERYAKRLNCAEINSSFYRPHKAETWKRWAGSVPAGFRFAVKMPKAITHEAGLACSPEVQREFLSAAGSLGEKLGPVLVQLPPKLAYDPAVAERFFGMLRAKHDGLVALEPRHASWFTADVEKMLREFLVARVAADPAKVSGAEKPGGWDGLVYYRLHGAPRTYYSAYTAEYLAGLAEVVKGKAEAWVVFDNTALGEAIHNALTLDAVVNPVT
jgi:uncharacterized protein YecE (DUF72 family)